MARNALIPQQPPPEPEDFVDHSDDTFLDPVIPVGALSLETFLRNRKQTSLKRRALRLAASWALAFAAGGILSIALRATGLSQLCAQLPGSADRPTAGVHSKPVKLLEEALRVEDNLGEPLPRERHAWTFAMMAYTKPGKPADDTLWGVLAMARALQKLSSYPLLLLTNTTHFSDGTDMSHAFGRLNVNVRPVKKVPLPMDYSFPFERWEIAFWKLQVWNLTEYEKIIWLDSDSIIYRGIDWLFEREWMWAQRDDWFCKGSQQDVCSGIMLLYPNRSDFSGMLDYFREVGPNLTKGDQQLIQWYFAKVRKRPVNLLTDLEASFGQCTHAPSVYKNADGTPVGGAWSTPAFVHKSGGWGNTNNNAYGNMCFTHDLGRQRYYIGDEAVNMCHFNPLAGYWRRLLCEAKGVAGLTIDSIDGFCSDACYFKGTYCPTTSSSPWISGEVSGTISADHLNASEFKGMPAPEKLRSQYVYYGVGGTSSGLAGNFNKVVRFDGAEMPEPPMTITIRIRTSWADNYQQDVLCWSAVDQTRMEAIEFRVVNGDLMYGENPRVTKGVRGGWESVTTNGTNVADGKWHNLAVVREADGKVTIYVDGTARKTGYVRRAHPTNLAAVAHSGRSVRNYNDFIFEGDVIWLRLYDEALSAVQIQALQD